MRIEGCEYPDDLLYDVEAGTWARKEGDKYRVGIAPQLSWISGGFTSVSCKAVGTGVEAGKSIGSVEGPRHFDVVRAPFDCIISATNPALQEDPRLANRDPFGRGWFALLEQTGQSSRLQSLPEAAGSVRGAIRRLGIHCFAEFPDKEMFEIGVECSAVLAKLSEEMATSSSGTVFHVVSDDPPADVEMTRWADQTGNRVVESKREGNLYHFIVKKS